VRQRRLRIGLRIESLRSQKALNKGSKAFQRALRGSYANYTYKKEKAQVSGPEGGVAEE